jgi:hypothetical protein
MYAFGSNITFEEKKKQFLRVAVSSQIIPFLGTTISDWDKEQGEGKEI